MRTYFPGGSLLGFPAAQRWLVASATPSEHRLQLGLPGYLIRFVTLAFVPHRRVRFPEALSPPVVRPGLRDFTPTPDVPLRSSGPKPAGFCRPPTRWARGFPDRPVWLATDALGPIIAAITRAAGITAAAGTGLAQPLFVHRLTVQKSEDYMPSHSESPYRTVVQCKVFAPAAPRRARNLVSDSVSRLLLSQPVPIIGTVGRYPTVYLIGRSHILWRRSISDSCHSRVRVVSRISLSFPRLFRSRG